MFMIVWAAVDVIGAAMLLVRRLVLSYAPRPMFSRSDSLEMLRSGLQPLIADDMLLSGWRSSRVVWGESKNYIAKCSLSTSDVDDT